MIPDVAKKNKCCRFFNQSRFLARLRQVSSFQLKCIKQSSVEFFFIMKPNGKF